MPNYIIDCAYSSGSWARMIRMADDRTEAVTKLMESVGGSLIGVYWEVSARGVHAIVDLPNSTAASAVAAVLTHTGAFSKVEIEEVLTQAQLNAVLELADKVSDDYRMPGAALMQDDSSESRVRH